MTIARAWNAYILLLRQQAPVTAACIRAPRTIADLRTVEANTTPWTDELLEFYALHDGQDDSNTSGTPVGTLLPDLTLLSLDAVLYTHRFCLENLHPIDDLGDDWLDIVAAQHAGDTAEMFLGTYVPFAKDGAGDFWYVDTRPGPRQGCIRYFAAEAADQGRPAYDSMTEYLDAVRVSVESRSELDGVAPVIRDGVLLWNHPHGESVYPATY